ncbi:uncharacterized protein LOC106771597 [Vigna radiata var. radiata]|uniref:Uncharacterized protein LOC106771597 n=1 Tax=Vigna radiata var. radiata TaxID=3916 RepID=A0A1S3V462_VIGRR|nr:uncharacterized protein LOC106771597 [Vigna radiata var. radiata]
MEGLTISLKSFWHLSWRISRESIPSCAFQYLFSILHKDLNRRIASFHSVASMEFFIAQKNHWRRVLVSRWWRCESFFRGGFRLRRWCLSLLLHLAFCTTSTTIDLASPSIIIC